MRKLMLAAVVVMSPLALAQEKQGYAVHDMTRPQPTAVTPATPSTQEQAGKAPSDATVLFDGKDLSKFKGEKSDEAPWKVGEGYFEIAPHTGAIHSKDEFGDCQLHVEWREAENVSGKSQARGNSGIFLMGLYELQVLDNYQAETYPDGMAGSLYGQYPPLVNASIAPGNWQTYDVIFHAAKTDSDGKVTAPARMTVLFNGVLVQDDMPLLGPTVHGALAKYPDKMPRKGPLMLQDHGNPVRYRNIWVRELKGPKPDAPVRAAGPGH